MKNFKSRYIKKKSGYIDNSKQIFVVVVDLLRYYFLHHHVKIVLKNNSLYFCISLYISAKQNKKVSLQVSKNKIWFGTGRTQLKSYRKESCKKNVLYQPHMLCSSLFPISMQYSDFISLNI